MTKQTSTFLWNVGNGLTGIAITYLSGIEYIYSPIIIATLSLITKELNRSFNPNYPKKDVES